jgi:hypothetical protein
MENEVECLNLSENKSTKKCITSVGIVAVTPSFDIVVLHKKAPYFVCDKFQRWRNCKKGFQLLNLKFSKNKSGWLEHFQIEPNSEFERLEVERFINNDMFEDCYDFPHGQIDKRSLREFIDTMNIDDISNLPEYTLTELFNEACREFEEETGYLFWSDTIMNKPFNITCIEFSAINGHYRQIYFICTNVSLYLSARRKTFYDMQYETIIMGGSEVYKLFKQLDDLYDRDKIKILLSCLNNELT